MKESFSFRYSKNTDLILSPSDLKSKYFFGVPIRTPDGTLMSDEELSYFIRSATEQIETYLDLKLTRQVIEETKDFMWDEYRNWGYIHATYPIVCPHRVDGFVGTTRQVQYPPNWFTVKKTNDGLYHRSIHIVPTNNGAATTNSVVYSGIYPHLGYYGARQIPQYWTITYTTGFDKIPRDIVDVIGMIAASSILDQLGDIILGVGIASYSTSIDGVSQSISTTGSATKALFGARITSYRGKIKEMMPKLKAKYCGIVFGVL